MIKPGRDSSPALVPILAMTLTNRIGTFLFWLGFILLFLFIFSDVADQPAFGYFCSGALCLVIGAVLWWRSPRPPSEPPARFRILKKMMKNRKDQ